LKNKKKFPLGKEYDLREIFSLRVFLFNTLRETTMSHTKDSMANDISIPD